MTNDAVLARALFNLYQEEDQLLRLAGDLKELREILAAEPNILKFLKHPAPSRSKKSALLEELLSEGFSLPLHLFFQLLLDENRLLGLEEILEQLEELLRKGRGPLRVELVSALPLAESLEKSLSALLEERFGEPVQLIRDTDPRLLGGLVLRLEDRELDLSLKGALREMERTLLA